MYPYYAAAQTSDIDQPHEETEREVEPSVVDKLGARGWSGKKRQEHQ